MAETKEPRRKRDPETENVEVEAKKQAVDETKSNEAKQSYIPATGLEDYGRWKAMFEKHQRDKKEPSFRRGRIWS